MATVEGAFGHCRGNAETVHRQEYRTLVGSCFAIAVAIAIANIIAISIARPLPRHLSLKLVFFIAMPAQLHRG
jgi:hypothetical protein